MSVRPMLDDGALRTEPVDFSLVLGGPLYQLWRGAHLAGDALDLVRRRILVMAMLTWAPLLLLSVVEGYAWGDSVRLPFLRDVETHMRLLLAVPLLVAAELLVHQRTRGIVGLFLERGLIPERERPQFETAIARAFRLRDSVVAEVILVVVVYLLGIGFIWRTQGALAVTTWYGPSPGGTWQPSLAGWWLGAVSLPVFQFLLIRWYFRLFIWARFLWHVSRLELAFEPMHPDRCGGLGFLGLVGHAFAPFLLAQGVVLAGTIGNRIFYAGATLPEFKLELITLAAVMVFAVLGPMLVFAAPLAAAKRAGLRAYGTLSQRYMREFSHKWIRGTAPPDEPLVGSGDIQSMADMANSFEVVKSMRVVPFTMQTVVQLAVTTLAPVIPLMLTMISLEELLQRLLTMVL